MEAPNTPPARMEVSQSRSCCTVTWPVLEGAAPPGASLIDPPQTKPARLSTQKPSTQMWAQMHECMMQQARDVGGKNGVGRWGKSHGWWPGVHRRGLKRDGGERREEGRSSLWLWRSKGAKAGKNVAEEHPPHTALHQLGGLTFH